MSVRTEAIGAPVAAVTADASLAWRRAALWGLLGAKVVSSWGVQWDIQWHTLIGRDSFWIAPHLMTYAGVVVMVGLSFGVLAATTLSPSWRGGDVVRVLGLTGTRGFHLAAWGIALTVLAAPIDDLWHRLFGLDVTLWSPLHLFGLAGAAVNSLGCLLLAREVYPADRRTLFVATIIPAAMFYGTLRIALSPAFDLAYQHSGVVFHTHAILGALLLPLGLISAARITRVRSAPLAVAVVSLLIGLSGDAVAHLGFSVLQPVSVIQEAIAQDPGSPIAIANAVARKHGERPGAIGVVPLVASLITVLSLIAVDARRYPRAASVAYAVATFSIFGWLLTHSPAFRPNTPDLAATCAALALTLLAALGGAAGATRLARMLEH